MNRRPSTPAPTASGSVSADEVLPLGVFLKRLGIGWKTWRGMKALGLKSVQVGKQRYIVGRHAIEFFERLADADGNGDETTTTCPGPGGCPGKCSN